MQWVVHSLSKFHCCRLCRKLKLQSKVKELTREIRNKDEELEDNKHKVETLKGEKRKWDKAHMEVWPL